MRNILFSGKRKLNKLNDSRGIIIFFIFRSCLAALGLIENSATNVVAAMLVSPLMVTLNFI